MSDSTPRWRRRRFLILAVLLLVVGGGLAWRFRPLTAAERRLVGTWGRTSPSEPCYEMLTLRPDRTFTMLLISMRDFDYALSTHRGRAGSWNCSSGTMSQRYDRPRMWSWNWRAILQRLHDVWKGEPRWETCDVEFRSDDRLRPWQSGHGNEYRRISDPKLLEWAAEPKSRQIEEAELPAWLRRDAFIRIFRGLNPTADQDAALDPVAE